MSNSDISAPGLSHLAVPLVTLLNGNPHLQTISVSACIYESRPPPEAIYDFQLGLDDLLDSGILLLRCSRDNPEHPHKWTLPTAKLEPSDNTLLDAAARAVTECTGMQPKNITKFLGWSENSEAKHRTYYFLMEAVEVSVRGFMVNKWKLPAGYYYASFFNYRRTMDNYGNYPDNSVPTFVGHAIDSRGGLRGRGEHFYRDNKWMELVGGQWKERG